MWSSWYRAKAAAVSRADHPSHGDQDVGSSIAAAFTRPHHSSSTPSGTLGDATTLWPAAYPPIAAVSGGCRRRQSWALCHELRLYSLRRSATIREMKEGPSSSTIRC